MHHAEATLEPHDAFWSEIAISSLQWDKSFHRTRHGSLKAGDHAWFRGGRLNASYNCIDRHAFQTPDKAAILGEGDLPGGEPHQITYAELLKNVSHRALVLKNMGVRRGEIVTIYMPNIPEAVRAMMACARVAAVWPGYYEPESMGAEDPLYLLNTSRSTSKPKYLLHATAGYLLGCAVSRKYALDLHVSDTMFCAGNVGWISGHSYLVYAPLALGLTTVIFDGTPSFPTSDRYLARTQVTHIYTAPTALSDEKGQPGRTQPRR
ncbi:acetyl-CoA synthetase-like protein [Aspergillus saccharolyticus JOP 1030-1]|uniref:acetate--CoA ligase n=1 Tax=Aspergillus saccharolyticus JOP 1030-1 TaxID=1450539 RepID=A0A318ZUY5_9EURO|nr:acetyl-CoA synthetase-like protein [Aspergillus saccharolyticus JOP 1030-1]PYH48173.1 acetyl-CoA synthetase-like protein [Aspergillus saccharolyticus JOP 1030-1]